MKGLVGTAFFASASAAAVILGGGASAHAALLGDSVRAQLTATGFGTTLDQTATVIDPGVEFSALSGLITLDVKDDIFDIVYDLTNLVSVGALTTWTLSDLDWIGSPDTIVTGLSLVSGDANSILGTSFTDDSVSVNFADLTNPPAVQSFSFNIQTSTQAIPTPALLPGLIGFGMSIVRKRKQAEAQA